MLFIYCFVSFMFFKILPEFLLTGSNTVIGALVMAVTSTLCMFGATFWINIKGIQSIETCVKRKTGKPDLFVLILPALAGISASMAACYLIGIGFSKELMYETFGRQRYFHSEYQVWFWVMVAAPPTLHIGIVINDIKKMAAQAQHMKN